MQQLTDDDLKKTALNTTFITHFFTADWQHYQYRLLKQNLKSGEVMLVMDFAENRKSQYQDEIKSARFNKQQITLHPVIAFYRSQSGQLVRHALGFITDDVVHDHNAVHRFTSCSLHFLQEKLILSAEGPLKVYIFSDSCAVQYKGRGTFADLTHYALPVQRIHYGSEHGKGEAGEADGETGAISKSLEAAVLCRTVFIRHAADLHQWCVQNLSKDEDLSKRTFFFVDPDQIQRGHQETNVKCIPGCRQFHQVAALSPLVLKAQRLACFCIACKDNHPEFCQNKGYTGLYKYKVHIMKQVVDPREESPAQPSMDSPLAV